MRPALIVCHVLLFLSTARALPFGLDAVLHIEKRHIAVETVERRHPQGLLDSLSSIGAEISSAFSPQTTQTLNSGSAVTRSSSDDDDETSTGRSTSTRSSSESTRTSTRRSTSTEESSTTTESSTSQSSSTSTEESTTSSTSSISESSTVAPTPVETARASSSPEASNSGGSGGVSTAGIAVGVVLGVALLAVIIFILFKWGPLAKWRENRAYEKMMERTYRPALDDKDPMGFNNSHDGGLGLAPIGTATSTAEAVAVPPNGGYRGVRPTNSAVASSPVGPAMPQRAFSYTEDRGVNAEQERIRRKPLPTTGTGGGQGGGQGASPLVGVNTPTGATKTEPWLPGIAK